MEEWPILEESILAIQNQKPNKTSLEELYQIVENIAVADSSLDIYDNVKSFVSNYVKSKREILLTESDAASSFLERLNFIWLQHCQQMELKKYLLNLLRQDLGLDIFRNVIMENQNIRTRCTKEMLKLISMERGNARIDRQLIKSLIRMLSYLAIYQSVRLFFGKYIQISLIKYLFKSLLNIFVFENAFLQTTKEFYELESKKLIDDLEVPEYLQYVKRRLDEETVRVDYYLDYSTQRPLLTTVDTCLIANHMESFVEKVNLLGFDTMVLENRFDELSLMHSLLSRTKSGLDILKKAFVDHIKNEGRKLVISEDSEKTFVDDLLVFKRKLDLIIDRYNILSCFDKNRKFVEAEKDAFDFVNLRLNKPAELVAKFMDSKLRAGNKVATEEELEVLMDEVIVIFRFIQGKDVFESYYKKDLAKRLLFGRSASVDAEKSVLSKLKHECGSGFTKKLEGMFKDMEVSRDIASNFKQYMEHEDRKGLLDSDVEYSVNVLTTNFWPHYDPMEVNLPQELSKLQEMFKQFYTSKYSGRTLQWQYSLSQLLLRAYFSPTVTKELQVSMFQALVLFLFNKKIEWSYEEILNATNIESNELCRTLQSLACGKLRVIKKNPRGKDVNPDDIFTFNSECNDKLYRIRICQIQMKETVSDFSTISSLFFFLICSFFSNHSHHS
ncbi:unnamed protein product [Dracunculus medinensis]|uniref:CULLIN_2 domain-containing protein n=1 Tax=Dracunculus medinensis TaxID=318479 RepID=A0A0N4UE77_DRAME|nr:unnamed protein product [Dracunculus medinensis]